MSGLVDWFVRTADAASQVIAPRRRRVLSSRTAGDSAFQTYDAAALEWFSVEQRNAPAAVELAAEWGLYDLSWKLTIIMHSYYNLNKGWREFLSSLDTALDAARRAGSDFGSAWVLNTMGVAYGSIGHYEEANGCLEQSLTLARAVGDHRGASMALEQLRRDISAYGPLRASDRVLRDGSSSSVATMGRRGRREHLPEQSRKSLVGAGAHRRSDWMSSPGAGDVSPGRELARGSRNPERPGRGVSPVPAVLPLQPGDYQLALAAYQKAGDEVGAAQVMISLAELAHERGELREARQWVKDALFISARVNEDDAPSLRRQIDALKRELRRTGGQRSGA